MYGRYALCMRVCARVQASPCFDKKRISPGDYTGDISVSSSHLGEELGYWESGIEGTPSFSNVPFKIFGMLFYMHIH